MSIKIKMLKDRFGYKANDVVELNEAEATEFVKGGYAEAVKPEDVFEKALSDLETKINEKVESCITEATAKITDKVSKGIAKSRPQIVVGNDNIVNDPQGGFKSYGEFAAQVVKFASRKETSETFNRYIKSTTGNTEGAAPDAGPTVPVQYTSDIFKITGGIPDFMAMAFQVPMSSSSVKIPVLKNYNRANTTVTAGVVTQYPGEAGAITQSKTNWEQLSLSLVKEAILVPVSNELLEDNIVALDAVLAEHSAYQIKKSCNGGILQGSSAFTGIIGGSSTKTVVRNTANEVLFGDILSMYAGFAHDDADYSNAVWFVHPTVLPQLGNMTSGNFNIYFPPGGAQNTPFGTLLGRPIIVTGWASALGSNGDVVLADMKKYVVGYRGGLNAAMSIHLFFNTDESAFRYTLRTNGRPGLSSVITLEDGSTTVSPYVQLNAAA